MQTYYSSLSAIEQKTMQLEGVSCAHCHRKDQLVSHGYVYEKRKGGETEAVGKRVFCSDRDQHGGCGRTMRLYLDSTVRYLNYAGAQVVAFMLALVAGVSVQQAYFNATGQADARHAYRWLTRLGAQLTAYRSLVHQAPLTSCAALADMRRPGRLGLLVVTFRSLMLHFGLPLCANFQRQLQRGFL